MNETAERTVGKWSDPRIPLAIEYSVAVMDDIRAAVFAGSAPAGVLFGSRSETSVRVTAWRPFVSPDSRDILRLLLSAKQDPALEAYQPLGYFISHARGATLDASDINIYDSYFSEPWQVALVLVPDANGAARAGFFARETDGSLRSESSYQEFSIEPPARVARRYQRLAPWALSAALAAILVFVLARPRQADPPSAGFSLRIQNTGIAWDPNSAPVRTAKAAEIDIQDGNQPSHFSLNAAQLHDGKMAWQPRTNDVQVIMTLHGNSVTIRESARLLVIKTASPPVAQPDFAAEVKRLTQELHQERVISDRLKQSVKILENTIAVDKARGNR